MAFEINDLKGILILVLIAIPTVASTNINCSGRAFHCVNSTHFMICVDLGGGVSTTIDDFIIPCPATTECHEKNIFECDFPEVTTPPLQVIGVNKPSDTSGSTLVTTTAMTADTSDIYSEVKENTTASTLRIAEDVTPVVKLEVLENMMTRVGVNNNKTTETSVISSLVFNKNDIFNDKRTSNNTVTTSATDNNKHLEHAVETSIHEAVNTSSIDKSSSIDMVTSVIGLINLISIDPSSEVSTKPFSNVLTSLDNSNENKSTIEQYKTKEVNIHGIQNENVTDKITMPTDLILSEKSVIADEVRTTPTLNTLIVNDINIKNENKTKTVSQTVAEQISFGKSNSSNKIVLNTTTDYLPPIQNVNISKPTIVHLNPQTKTDNTFVSIGQVNLISAEQNQSIPSTNDYLYTFHGETITTTTNHFNTNPETTLSVKPATAEIISTTPVAKIILNSEKNNYSTVENVKVEKVIETTNTNTTFSGYTAVASMQTSTEKTSFPITTEATMVNTTETNATTEALINNDLPVEKQTIVTQPSEIVISKDLPIVLINNFDQINGELPNNISVDNINTTKGNSTVFNDSGTDIIIHKVIEPVLILPSIENPAIEMATTETLRKGFAAPAIEAANELQAIIVSSTNEPLNNGTLLNNTTDTMSPIETVTTGFNALNSDIGKGRETEPTTKKYPTIEISTNETLQNEFTKHAIEAKNEMPATNDPINVNEHHLKNVGINALLRVHTTNAPNKVTSDPVKNTLVTDLKTQSDIATNLQTGFNIAIHNVPEDNTSINHATTQKAVTDLVNIIPESLNQPDNLEEMRLSETSNVDQWTSSISDVVRTTTSSDGTVNTSIREIYKFGNQDNPLGTSFVNTEDISLKIIETSTSPSNDYLTELSKTTPVIFHARSIMDSIQTIKQASTNIPNIADIHSISTTDNKIETSTMFSADATLYTSNSENITDITPTILPQQKLLNQKQYSTTAATKRLGDFVPPTKTTAGYIVDTKHIDFNISNQTTKVNTINMISNVDLDTNSNQTEAINPINGKNSVNATFHDEIVKIVSVLDVVNASGNAIPIEMLQPTSSNPSLSNDYIKTTGESQASSVYVSATDNVPDYISMHVEESASQKTPQVIMLSAETKTMDSIFTASSTRNFLVSEINKAKNQHVSTDAHIPSTVDLKHIKLTTTAVDYVTEKTNGDFSTETMLTQQNSTISLRSVTPNTVTPFSFTKVPVYDKLTKSQDSAFITSSTQMTLEVVTDNNTKMNTEYPRLTSKLMAPQTDKYKTEFSLPSAYLTTDSIQTTILAQSTPLDEISQNTRPGIKTTVSLHDMPTVNYNIPESMTSLRIVGVTATQMTTESTKAAVFAETTPLAINEMHQNIQPGVTTTDYPQYLVSKVNNNSPQSILSPPVVETAATKNTSELTHSIVIAQTTPLALTDKLNQDVELGTKTTDLPHYVSLTISKKIPQSKSSLPLVEVTAAQITTEPTHTTKISETTPVSAPDQDILPGIKTTNLSQYATTTVTYYNAQSISDKTTNNVVDSLTEPDSMVETIKVVGDKKNRTHLGETILGDVMTNPPIIVVDNVKTVKNIIDHESIVVGTTSKDDERNTVITSAKPVDINKAETMNHTESNWMAAEVNLDYIKIKESAIEKDGLNYSMSKSGTGFKNKTLALNSSIISQMQSKGGIPVDKIEYERTTIPTDYKQADSGVPKIEKQLKTIITDENKNSESNSSLNANIEIIDVKKDHVLVDFKNIHNYNINNTKANISSSSHNLSLQNSTINDELQQYLISTNHTITTGVQSRLNESDKQSNITSNDLTLNGVHSLNLTKLNAAPASGFNCSNLTRGKYSDKKDCRKFYTCIGNLQPVIGTCPNNTVFSELNKQCTRNLSHCVRNNQFRCLFEGRFSDFFKDNIYYICVKNRIHGFIRYKLQCQDAYYLNKDLIKCERNEEISTQSGSVSETINDETKPEPKSEKMVSSYDFECEKIGKFPYAKDCSKYYECTKVKNVYRRKIKK